MKDHISNSIPKKYISKEITKSILDNNFTNVKDIANDNGVTLNSPKVLLPALSEEFKKNNLTHDKIKSLISERHCNIYDIAMDSDISKENIDLNSADKSLQNLAKLNNLVKDQNINIANITIDEKKELYSFLRERLRGSNEDTAKDIQVVPEAQGKESTA